MGKFDIKRAEQSRIGKIDWDNLGFGVYFSDHVYLSDAIDGNWDQGKIIPYGPLEYEPAFSVIHYGQSIFEGLKAYRAADGSVNIFRPDMNAKRLNSSAERLCMPPFDQATFLAAVKELVKIDYNFIPKKRGTSLYIRPVMFGSGNFLGVHESRTVRLIIMTSPVASYYKEGMKPIKILVAHDYVRAVKGGLGSAKTAGNYAASLLAGKKAREAGYAQVLWLDGITREYVDEVGAMNIVFVIDGKLVTPPLSQGSILAGVTRDTVIALAPELGFEIEERPISIKEIQSANKEGKLQEVFGTGTAAIISPVGELNFNGQIIGINNGEIGPIAQKFYDTITGIQYAEIPDTHGWLQPVELD